MKTQQTPALKYGHKMHNIMKITFNINCK